MKAEGKRLGACPLLFTNNAAAVAFPVGEGNEVPRPSGTVFGARVARAENFFTRKKHFLIPFAG